MGNFANLLAGPANIYIADNGTIATIPVQSGGTGYSAPVVAISAPPPGGTQATATATLTSTAVSSITVTSGGTGYVDPAMITVTVTGGGGTGFVAGVPTLTYANVDFGFTKGPVKLDVTAKQLGLTADQLGSTVVDYISTGIEAKVVVPCAEYTLVNLRRIYANAFPVLDGTSSLKRRLELRPRVGRSFRAAAKSWVFKPIDPATGVESTNKDMWLTIPAAFPDPSTLSMEFAAESQRIIQVTLYCFPDTSGNNYRVAYFGDSSAVDTNGIGF